MPLNLYRVSQICLNLTFYTLIQLALIAIARINVQPSTRTTQKIRTKEKKKNFSAGSRMDKKGGGLFRPNGRHASLNKKKEKKRKKKKRKKWCLPGVGALPLAVRREGDVSGWFKPAEAALPSRTLSPP